MRRERAEKNLIKNHIVKRYAQHILVVVVMDVVVPAIVVVVILFLYVFVMRAFVAIFGFCLCATNQQRQLQWAKTWTLIGNLHTERKGEREREREGKRVMEKESGDIERRGDGFCWEFWLQSANAEVASTTVNRCLQSSQHRMRGQRGGRGRRVLIPA